GNKEDNHTVWFRVDNTPPETTIEWGNPQYWNGSMWYVNLSTQVWLNTSENYTDTQLCDVGCNYTYYEVWYDSNHDDVVDTIEQSGMELDNDITFYFANECLHEVIYYGVDYLGNKEDNHTVWFRVDNTPPVSVIDPITPYCQHINATNPLQVSATITDYPVLCASGVHNATLWYRYARYNNSFTDWFMFGTDTSSPWQWDFTAPNGSGYYQFYVAAYDNLQQNEQPFPPNDTTPPKERVSASYNHTFELVYNHTGWNLITMPVKHESIHTASDLIDYINTFSPDVCTVVTRWDRENQQYVSYVAYGGGFGGDFSLTPGEGYFIYVTKNVTVYMEGCLIEYDEINMTLNVGYNMIGWANLEKINASQIAGNISGCTMVTKWNSSSQGWFIPSYLVVDPSHDFNITIGEAMFVFRPTGGTMQWDGGRSMLVLPPP
ncbi:MAG: hypothetical protein J7J34_05335, partial [Thermoplasmata archaeon]|nr:hypothetical protein [Thermoplasmata archaeon]